MSPEASEARRLWEVANDQRDGDQGDADVRLGRVLAARDAGDTAALIASLRDPDNRSLAAQFLGDLEAKEAAAEIARLLDATDPLARSRAARALGLLGATDALPRLRELAEVDPVAHVRGNAVTAVGRLAGTGAVPFLIDCLTDREWRVRVGAAFALGLIGDPRAREPIRKARRRDGVLHIARWQAYAKALARSTAP
jgi:HEAT repeat protein